MLLKQRSERLRDEQVMRIFELQRESFIDEKYRSIYGEWPRCSQRVGAIGSSCHVVRSDLPWTASQVCLTQHKRLSSYTSRSLLKA